PALDIEAVTLQFIRHVLCVVGDLIHDDVVVRIFGVADHQRDFGGGGGEGTVRAANRGQACQQQNNNSPHEMAHTQRKSASRIPATTDISMMDREQKEAAPDKSCTLS